MQIWTTQELNDMFLGNGLPVRLLPDRKIGRDFIENSGAGDIALLPFDEGYLEFLAAAKAKGIHGPFLFISPEPTMIESELNDQNTMVLDMKRMGSAEVRKIVNFVLTIALQRVPAQFPEMSATLRQEERADTAVREASHEILSRLRKDGVPISASFQVIEDGRSASAQGGCFLKSVAAQTAVFHRFRPKTVLKGLKKDMEFSVRFSMDGRNYHSGVKIESVGEDEITAAFPERLRITTRKYLRIRPSSRMPVQVYAVLPGQPTTPYAVEEISQRGFAFYAPNGLEVGAVSAFSVAIPDSSAYILSTGIIRSKIETDMGFRYGVELLLHPRDEENIARYVMQREQELAGLLRER